MSETKPQNDPMENDFSASEMPEGQTDAAESSVDAAEDALQQAQAEVASLKDQILRAMAETENTRRRLAKEGYLAIAPELYFRQGDVSTISDIPRIISEVVFPEPEGPRKVTNRSSPTSWIFPPRALVSFCQPSQSSS